MKIIIVGCGRVGRGLAEALRQRGDEVTVIDKNASAFEALGPFFKGRTIEGIGFDRDVLLEAGIKIADGLAAVTSEDETNVLTAQVARQLFHVPKVVARLYDPQQAEIYHRLGLQTICTTAWGISRITDLLTASSLEPVFTTNDLEVLQVEIPPLLAGRTVRELSRPGEVSVVSIIRKGKSIIPTSGTVFENGDLAYVATLTTSIECLHQMLDAR